MPASLPPALERWLRDPSHNEVEATWVPGLTARERKALFAAGGVARGLLAAEQMNELPVEVRRWMNEAPEPPSDALELFRATIEHGPDEAFASLYSVIVSRAHRRQLGTFFTPAAEVKLMLDLWMEAEQSPPHTVVDVGAGVGVFTAEAAKRWPKAHVIAVDINPVTLGLLAVRLFSKHAPDTSSDLQDRLTLVRRDYTEWLSGEDAPAPGGRLILGNPPYTRAQLMSIEERQRLHDLTNGLCGSRASLSTLITALTFQHLAPSDGLSLLLPAQWLESQYARDLRRTIWSASRRAVELRLVESEDLFGGAQVDAVALMVGTEQPAIQAFRVARWREAAPRALARQDENPASWRRPFDEDRGTSAEGATVALSDLADVKRGVATGSNSTFILHGDAAETLPASARKRVITRLVEFGDQLSEESVDGASSRAAGWLLTVTPSQVASSRQLRTLIDAAEEEHIHERVLCASRRAWYDLTAEVRKPDVLVGAMTQDRFRLVENPIGATHTNNLYGFTWHQDVSVTTRGRVLEWLRSDDGQVALTSVARRQGAGLLKLEPGALRAVRIPQSVVEESTHR